MTGRDEDAELTPETGFRLTLVQLVALALAIGGVGFSVGAVYPRLLAVETAVSRLQGAQTQTALALERVTAVVDRMDREDAR